MVWFRIDVSQHEEDERPLFQLCRTFQHAFMQQGAPPEMALFAQCADEEGPSHALFVSARSTTMLQVILKRFGGVPCEAPSAQDVTLLFGVPDASRRLLTLTKNPISA